jgi:hypothetical protein
MTLKGKKGEKEEFPLTLLASISANRFEEVRRRQGFTSTIQSRATR